MTSLVVVKGREIERFRKQVFDKVLQEIEEKELAEAKGRVNYRKKVPQYLFTRLGLITPQLLKLNRLVDDPSEKLDNLVGYLEENWDGIYGTRNRCQRDAGGVEKNIDLILCRRLKTEG